jgi:hypothetical protein
MNNNAGIISAVLRDMPVLFLQGNMHVQCYRSKLLWFYNNSSWMQWVLLKTVFFGNCIIHIGNYDPWFVFMQFCRSPCFVPMQSQCLVNIQRPFSHHTQWTSYFLTFCKHILPPSIGLLDWSRWMLKWSGGRKFVGYVVRFEGIWQ